VAAGYLNDVKVAVYKVLVNWHFNKTVSRTPTLSAGSIGHHVNRPSH